MLPGASASSRCHKKTLGCEGVKASASTPLFKQYSLTEKMIGAWSLPWFVAR